MTQRGYRLFAMNEVQHFIMRDTEPIRPFAPRTLHNRQRIDQCPVKIKQETFTLHGNLHQALIIWLISLLLKWY